MLGNWKFVVATMLFAVSSTAQATIYRLTATGTVNALYGQDAGRVLDATGTFQLGQKITYSALFDTSNAMPASYDVPYGIAYYSLGQPTEYSIRIGDWQYSPDPNNHGTLNIQVTNDYTAGGGYDSESFSLNEYTTNLSSLPYLMNGPTQITSYVALYGDTSVLQSTRLSSIVDPVNFPNRQFQIAFTSYGSSTRQYLVQGRIDAQLSAVPESASWMMMILGFGLIGSAARGQVRRNYYRCRGRSTHTYMINRF